MNVMKWFADIWSKEPVMILGLISAGIAFASSFGLHLTNEQTAAIMGLVGALVAITRTQVTPNDKAKASVLTALTLPVGATENDVKVRVDADAGVPSLDTPTNTAPVAPK